ncbi:hypothetical protein BGZ97_001551 [Linnemannia gamsii]|uniref:Disintegrin and metalloproteinase domain-containing protein B n=1 Tax=Linnemannia gamsii TaxID=64522 RepID=A0A9P6R0A8_9FUNG|nr:hypothetical protein BGZ97_001551 [Linnemannia gamsii]
MRTSSAHSQSWPTITRAESIAGLRHDILPRAAPYELHRNQPLAKRNLDQILSAYPDIISREDTIRFQFSAFNTTFHLYLEPNTDFLHPEADLGPDVDLDDIKAFKGIVIQDQDHADRKWKRAATTSRIAKRTVEHMLHEDGVAGWARMMVEHDPSNPDEVVLRGAFMVNGDTYHVTTRQHYHVQKRSDDAVPHSFQQLSDNSMVIFRDSDLYNPNRYLKAKRGLHVEETTCGSDTMLNRTAAYIEATSSHEYYYPPDRTSTIPMAAFDASSSWTDILAAPMSKRGVAIKVAGPNPVPAGCPQNRLVNYMGVAADCSYVRNYGGAAGARKQIFADFNTASGIYESTFNVALGVIALNIKTDNCPATPVSGEEWNQDCTAAYTIDQRLSDFSRWRGQGGRDSDGAGLWHLMTKCNSGPVVGIAWTKALCQMKSQSQNGGQGLQYTAGTGVSSITPNEWMVVSHEVGHGFGAIHDCTTGSCPAAAGQCCPLSDTVCDAGAQFIMNPSEQTPTKVFSPCSIRAICGTIQSSSGQCLKPPGTRQTQSSETNICGNGLKEAGEDCDCGSAEDCAKDPCCDGTTCKFKGGAVCDDLNDDCCLNCQLRSAGFVCRAAISECDIQEVCTGTSATCPADVRVENLTPCNGPNNSTSGLQCSNGVCTSRDLQCQQQDRQGINRACGASNGCDLMCNDPGGNSLACTQIPGTYFLDGTACGFGGTCASGSCQYSNGIQGVLAWARGHLSIVIPVGCVLGIILLCCIWSCFSGCCRRRRQAAAYRKRSGSRPGTGSGRSRVGPPQGPDGTVQGAAQHGGQQYPMGPVPVPPPAVYHDPNVLRREDQEMQWALEESRKEHERQQARHMSGSDLYAPPAGDPPTSAYSRNGASVVATPHVEEASLNPFQTTAQFPASSQQQDTAGLTLSAKYSPMPTPVLPAQIVQQYSPPQTAPNAYSPPQTAPPTGYTPPSTSRYTPPSTLPRQDPGDIFADPPLPPLPAPTSGPSDSSYRPTGFI